MPEMDGFGGGVAFEMAEKMRIKEGDDNRTVLSKKLSYVLRHGAKQLDLVIDDEGYVGVNDLLACSELFEGVALEALLEVVKVSNVDKQRYEILEQDGDWLIRATGKHTMQGLARAEAKRRPKKLGREAGPGSGGAAGERRRPTRQVSEEEFCTRWRLDRLARVRLGELPPASRQLAMQRFSPGPQVPASDFPKVFVAFCKRFRQKGKEDGMGFDVDDEFEAEDALGGQSRAGTASRSRGKNKMGWSRDSEQAPASRSSDNPSNSVDTMSAGETQTSSKPAMGLSLSEVDRGGGMNAYYHSPGSTPRSKSPERGLLLHSLGGPVSPPAASAPAAVAAQQSPSSVRQMQACGSPQGTPQGASQLSTTPPMTAPPPPMYPPHGVPLMPVGTPMLPPRAPPPPTHAPQVLGFRGYEPDQSGSAPHDRATHQDRGSYQDASAMQAHASQWGMRSPQADMRVQRNAPPVPLRSPPGGPPALAHSMGGMPAQQVSGLSATRAVGGYQDMAALGYDGTFDRDGYDRSYDNPEMYHGHSPVHGYPDAHSPHIAGRSQMSNQAYYTSQDFQGFASEHPTAGTEAYRGVAVDAWTPAVDDYGACY